MSRSSNLCVRLITIVCGVLLLSSAHSETLTVGLGDLDYPPFYYTEDSATKGAAIEIAEAVAELSGYELIYRRAPWKRLQYFLKDGSIDMVILYFKTPERERDVVYTTEPHIYEDSYLMLPKIWELDFNGDLESLADYDFFYVRGYSHGPAFDHTEVLKKHPVDNEMDLVRRIASDRPFIGVGNKPALLRYAREAGVQNAVQFLEPPIDRGANYMAFSRERPDAAILAEKFSKAFADYSQSVDYKNVLIKYGFSVH